MGDTAGAQLVDSPCHLSPGVSCSLWAAVEVWAPAAQPAVSLGESGPPALFPALGVQLPAPCSPPGSPPPSTLYPRLLAGCGARLSRPEPPWCPLQMPESWAGFEPGSGPGGLEDAPSKAGGSPTVARRKGTGPGRHSWS